MASDNINGDEGGMEGPDDTIIEVGSAIYSSPIGSNPSIERETITGSEEKVDLKNSSEDGYLFIKVVFEEMKQLGKQPQEVLNNLQAYLKCYEEHNMA